MGTKRQDMMEMLRGGTANALELSQALGIREKDVYGHLDHVARSLAASGEKLVVLPARCMSCGFVFKVKATQSRPGRCPQCQGSHIEAPRYRIE